MTRFSDPEKQAGELGRARADRVVGIKDSRVVAASRSAREARSGDTTSYGRGRSLTVTGRGSAAVLRGHRVATIARQAGLKPIYSGAAQGWLVDADRVGDSLAYCQSRHIAVAVHREDG